MLTCQISHVSKAYSNANNTEKPTADGNNGLIPAYTVADVVFETPITKQYKLKAGINNLMDARYFTRRSGGYPGPGLLPADGRTVFATFEVKL
jgi:Fe(3+) dicitrate transport protein